ncbi:hypothetical protein PUP68_20030 [Pseudomonas chlororaphis]|uniref:DUF5862 family protein n=1 Tax=Pseudomonas chlororaphis TaxID=587753 RepID=UPI002368D4F2|nr:hypothetical protein [Pseudomonas chlororaphis]WDG77625.1 hypothetical protein PUP77_24830 [Pseudomonas chlororaphis]WDG83138.1 hypothetical protein PUP68_20030 [Pseudomonas chlororaphis]
MKELNQHEVDLVSGALSIKGMIYGLGDGAAAGMAIGGKWGGAGGWGWGGLAQLFGLIIPTGMGAVTGGIGGLLFGQEYIKEVIADYRDKFGPGNVSHTTI